MKKVGIIGAGRFGMELAKSLAEAGVEVLLLERSGPLVQTASSLVACAVQGDATNERVLQEAGVAECDVVVVAIGSNVEASMLVTANCKELGVKKVVAKATSDLHGRILDKLGADLVVYPDRETAHRLSRTLVEHGPIGLLELSGELSIAEISAPACCQGQTLAQADVRKRFGVTVLGIRRRDETSRRNKRVLLVPKPDDVVLPDDKLVVCGAPRAVSDFSANP